MPPARVSVINNSIVFKSSGKGPLRRLREEFGADERTLVMLSVAMFRPEKNQRELIELCTLLPKDLDWQLWFAGDGPTLGACVHRVEELNLTRHIRFLGFTPDPGAAYAGADLAVHASTSEALSNFLIEAQAHGLPCVAYEAQGNGECIIPSRTGFIVRQGDRRAFVEAILSLAAEPPENRAARSKLARSFARESFDETRQIDAYLELFAKLRAG
jgi:glycosyltransferase involved in cell wall biosynthesis